MSEHRTPSYLDTLKTRRDLIVPAIGVAAVSAIGVLGGASLVHHVKNIRRNRLGVDVSWPQENIEQLPTDFAFAVVGVTGGLPTTPNPRLAEQLEWAQQATGEGEQPSLQLYVNTANPGELIDQIVTWPTSDEDLRGDRVQNPHGTCDGTNSEACSWLYGRNRVIDIVENMFDPAADEAGVETDPSAYKWWLDVEKGDQSNTGNTWQSGSEDALKRNVAMLEGMVAHFEELGCSVGLYSPSSHWREVVGDQISESSNLNGIETWYPGAENKEEAKYMCEFPPLTSGGEVVLVQYVVDELDYNYSCD